MLAFLADGESWSSSALALALGSQPAHRAARARCAGGGRQGAVVRPRPGAALDDAARAGIHDDLVTPRAAARRTRIATHDVRRNRRRSFVSTDPFRAPSTCMASPMTASNVWFAARRQAERRRSGERQDAALDRRRRACGNGLRRPAPVPDRRGSHPEDRSEDRPRARHDPGARRRRRLGARLGRRDALGRAVSRPQDPSDRSRRRARSCAPSSPTASSPASPGSTASCGTAPGKATRASCGASIREPARCWRRLDMPPGIDVSGLESDGGDRFFCGGGSSGKVRAVRRPR